MRAGVPETVAVGEPVIADGGQIGGGELLQRGARVRTLDGDLRVVVARQADLGVEVVVRPDVLEILLLVGGVDAQEIVVVGDFVDQHVVDESAVLVEQARILDLAGLEAAGGVGGDVIGQPQRLRAGDVDLAHVADIENTHAAAHGEVFFDQRGILHGHVPAAEIHHFGAHRAMGGVQAGGFQGGRGGHQIGTVARVAVVNDQRRLVLIDRSFRNAEDAEDNDGLFRVVGNDENAIIADATAEHTPPLVAFQRFTFASNGWAAICVSVRAKRFRMSFGSPRRSRSASSVSSKAQAMLDLGPWLGLPRLHLLYSVP